MYPRRVRERACNGGKFVGWLHGNKISFKAESFAILETRETVMMSNVDLKGCNVIWCYMKIYIKQICRNTSKRKNGYTRLEVNDLLLNNSNWLIS